MLGSLVSTDNACLPVVMSLENPVFAGKGGITRRKGGGSLIKRNLLVRGREIAGTPVTIGVDTLYDEAAPSTRACVHLRPWDRPKSAVLLSNKKISLAHSTSLITNALLSYPDCLRFFLISNSVSSYISKCIKGLLSSGNRQYIWAYNLLVWIQSVSANYLYMNYKNK